MKRTFLAFAITGLFSTAACAQTAASETGRDVDQQQRIEQGLQNGTITT